MTLTINNRISNVYVNVVFFSNILVGIEKMIAITNNTIVLTLKICRWNNKDILPRPFKPIKDFKAIPREDKSVK